LAGSCFGGIVFQDNFAEEPNSTITNYPSFQNWDVTNGYVDLLSSGYCNTANPCVDLDGSTATASGSTMLSKNAFNLVAGVTYTITLDFCCGAEADAIGVSVGAYGISEGGGYAFPHTLTGTFTVSAGNAGAAPEPGTFATLAGACALLACLRRR
jgi:hypothetical protein